MDVKKSVPYGYWESIISPKSVCGGSTQPWETKIDQEAYYWTEQRPLEGGRTVIIRWTAALGRQILTLDGYSVRTRVYVYGGAAFAVKGDTLYFVNDKDGSIYAQKIAKNGNTEPPYPLTSPSLSLKYAELQVAEKGLIALTETSDEKNALTYIDFKSGSLSTLVEGADFYSSPQLSPDGDKLAWLEWNHPDMPWDQASLWVGEFSQGTLLSKQKVAGGEKESVTQSNWSSNGKLGFVSDLTGWWNLYEWDPFSNKSEILYQIDAEFGVPQWRFNTTWGYNETTPTAAYKTDLGWHLGKIEKGQLSQIQLPFNSYAQVKVYKNQVLFVAGAWDLPLAVYLLDLKTNALQQLSEPADLPSPEWVSKGRAMSFPADRKGIKKGYGFFYPPKNPLCRSEGLPPVIVKIHGGPTGAAEVSMRPVIQFWTSRGFALFDIDYTGSTGYGRLFREALKGQWGIADRDDILQGVSYLVDQGLVDPKRLYISGSSAGGFTLLRALTSSDLFSRATCYYGVSDLKALATETHKFEKHYLDQLIAPYPEGAAIYEERSPINEVDKIRASVLIFQGLEDKVVPPSQSRLLFEKLRENGADAELVEYEGEGHGFRQGETLLDTLKRELFFFQK